MGRRGKGCTTMMVCGSLFLSNSMLMLVVELCSPYLLCVSEFLQPGRTGCPTGWNPAWSSEPARGLAGGHFPLNWCPGRVLERVQFRRCYFSDENCKPELRPFLAVQDPMSRGTYPVHSSLDNHMFPAVISPDAAGSASLLPVTMPISAMAPGGICTVLRAPPRVPYELAHVTPRRCRVF